VVANATALEVTNRDPEDWSPEDNVEHAAYFRKVFTSLAMFPSVPRSLTWDHG
jgi:hypothetical protein